MIERTKKVIKAVSPPAIVFALATASSFAVIDQSRADLQQEMGSAFDSVLVNATDPKVVETARRGGLAGGQIQARSDIMDIRPLSLQLPSFSAGCGGLDLTGGSFSFINADQFVEFAKTTAQNAVGYAFYLALESIMPIVRQTMQGLQEFVTKMNQFLSDSCRTAKMGVQAALGAENNEAALSTVNEGITDVFSSFSSQDGATPDDQQENNEEIYNNLIWKELVGTPSITGNSGIASWFSSGEDGQFYEIIMNITGTYVSGNNDSGDDERNSLSGSTLVTLEDLMGDVDSGGTATTTLKYFACTNKGSPLDPGGCTNIAENISSVTVKGFAARSEESMMKILDAISVNSSLSPQEGQFLSSMRSPASGMLFRLARMDLVMARNWARDYAKALGLDIAYHFVMDAHTAGQAAANNSGSVWADRLQEILDRSRSKINDDYEKLRDKYGTTKDAMEEYETILNTMPKSGESPPGYYTGGNGS